MDWFIAGEWALRLGMIPIVAYRRRLTSALSWLAVVFFFPWIGALLYLLFAEHRMTRRARRHARIVEAARRRRDLAFQDGYASEPVVHGETAALGELTRRLGGFSLLAGNDVEVLPGDDHAVARLVDDLDGATDHIHLLFYTIEDDRTGRAVGEALERASRRGVTCRVLADAIGSRRFHRKLAPRLREAGVDVRKVLPLPFLLRRLRPLDLRNHRKLAVVDGELGYTGSMNLVDYDTTSGGSYAPWRDVTLRLRGPVVQQLQLVFHEDWQYNAGETLDLGGPGAAPHRHGDVPAQLVPSGPTTRVETIHHLLVAAIGAARHRLIITSPYLIPDEPTRVALALAALRGVRIDIIVPSRCDSRVVTIASQSYYEGLLDAGVTIHEHRDGFLHSKTMTVDRELAMIGSANFDRRSFYLNFELNLLVYGADAVDRVRRLQEEYIGESRPLDGAEWKRRGILRRLSEDVVHLLSPLF